MFFEFHGTVIFDDLWVVFIVCFLIVFCFFPQHVCFGYPFLLSLNDKACNAGTTLFPHPSVHRTPYRCCCYRFPSFCFNKNVKKRKNTLKNTKQKQKNTKNSKTQNKRKTTQNIEFQKVHDDGNALSSARLPTAGSQYSIGFVLTEPIS